MLLLTSRTQPARAELEAKWNSGSDFELGSFDSEGIDDALHTLGARSSSLHKFFNVDTFLSINMSSLQKIGDICVKCEKDTEYLKYIIQKT